MLAVTPGLKYKMVDNENKQQEDYFSWEASYSKAWSVILDDEADSIENSIKKFNSLQHKRLTRNISLIPGLKKGLIRNFVIILDASKVGNETDLYPTRLKWILNRLIKFSKDYFDQNPLCQLGIVITRDGVAEKLADLTNDQTTIECFLTRSIEGSGDASLKNSLDLALSLFGNIPTHVSKEILLIQIGLSSCDAGDINESISRLKEQKSKVSVISFLGQVYLSEFISKSTGGNYDVVLNEDHFMRLIMQYIQPPPVLVGDQKSLGYLVQMGFPSVDFNGNEYICLCHNRPSRSGFSCPRCGCKVCSIPSDCPICQLTLISSSHLARSYHHLFPVAPFRAEDPTSCSKSVCFCCSKNILKDAYDDLLFKCDQCQNIFCSNCDTYIHGNLHNCPGCLLK